MTFRPPFCSSALSVLFLKYFYVSQFFFFRPCLFRFFFSPSLSSPCPPALPHHPLNSPFFLFASRALFFFSAPPVSLHLTLSIPLRTHRMSFLYLLPFPLGVFCLNFVTQLYSNLFTGRKEAARSSGYACVRCSLSLLISLSSASHPLSKFPEVPALTDIQSLHCFSTPPLMNSIDYEGYSRYRPKFNI